MSINNRTLTPALNMVTAVVVRTKALVSGFLSSSLKTQRHQALATMRQASSRMQVGGGLPAEERGEQPQVGQDEPHRQTELKDRNQRETSGKESGSTALTL